MKIALIIEHFDPERGGAEHLTVWLAGELARRGHDIHVICHDTRFSPLRAAHQGASWDAERSRTAHGLTAMEVPAGVQVHRLPGFKVNTSFGFRSFGQRARQWCREHRPDVAHSMTVAWPGDLYHPHAGIYAQIQAQAIATREKASAIAWKRLSLRFSAKQRLLRWLERRATQSYAQGGPWKILSLSPTMSRQLMEDYQLPAERIEELENPRMGPLPDLASLAGPREEFRQHYQLAPSDPVAVFVGHDFQRKGLRWAIEAIARTKAPWKLLVVGLGKVRPYLELVERMRLSDRIKFVGPTRRMDLIYGASDALLLPTFYDSFGLVAVEALAYGRPVISTRFLGCGHLVEEAQAGLLAVSPRDVMTLADGLDRFVPGTADEPARMERARRVVGELQPEAYVARLEAVYGQFLFATGGRGGFREEGA